MICVAPSGSGKTVLLISLIVDIYPHCFERIFTFSPTVHVDKQWDAVKKFQAEKLKVDASKEQCYFDDYDPTALEATNPESRRSGKAAFRRPGQNHHAASRSSVIALASTESARSGRNASR